MGKGLKGMQLQHVTCLVDDDGGGIMYPGTMDPLPDPVCCCMFL